MHNIRPSLLSAGLESVPSKPGIQQPVEVVMAARKIMAVEAAMVIYGHGIRGDNASEYKGRLVTL